MSKKLTRSPKYDCTGCTLEEDWSERRGRVRCLLVEVIVDKLECQSQSARVHKKGVVLRHSARARLFVDYVLRLVLSLRLIMQA